MFTFIKKRKKIKQLEEQLYRMFLLLINTESMQLSKMPDNVVIQDLQKVVFVFTACIIRPIFDKEISLKDEVKCLNQKQILALFVKSFRDKALEICENANFSKEKLEEIFNEGDYYKELAEKYKSGELNFP